MKSIDRLEHLKLLGDGQSLSILRRLMVAPATLSQLGDSFRETPAHIRYHLKLLEQAGFVEPDSVNLVGNLVEKYYRASAEAYQLNWIITPEISSGRTPLTISSNDMALRGAAAEFAKKDSKIQPVVLSMDSLEGLVKLRQGLCQMATCHLLDPASADYNRGYIRHLFSGQAMTLIHLYHREAGLLVRAGNPKHIHGLDDLARRNIRLVNRESGSGMRVWLDDQLKRLGIPPEKVKGYPEAISSHNELARAIAEGRADTGVGLHCSADEFDLEFIPLFEEPYDLVFAQKDLSNAEFAPFLDYLHSRELTRMAETIGGYVFTPEIGRMEMIV